MAKRTKKLSKQRNVKGKSIKARDLTILAGIRGEIQIGTIKNSANKKRYNRKKMKREEQSSI